MQRVMRKLGVFIVASAMVLTFAGTAWARTTSAGGSGVSSGAVYNSIPGNLPGNVPSIGFEATQTAEFGDEGCTRRNGQDAWFDVCRSVELGLPNRRLDHQ
jgi:hypothetical protein